MTITRLETFTTLADFEKAGKRISSGISGYERLMQTASVAALSHIAKHGNYNVLEPLYRAALSWRNPRLVNAWVAWVVEYSWLVFNPRKLTGKALSEAKASAFTNLWQKSKGKAMNIDGAKAANWYEAKPASEKAAPVQMAIKVAAIQKQLNKLLKDNMLLDTDGKPVDLAKLRTELRAMIETLEVPHKPIVQTATAKTKAKAKAKRKAAARAMVDRWYAAIDDKAKAKAAAPIVKDDMVIPPTKQKIVEETRKLVEEFEQQYNDGLITQGEKYNKVITEIETLRAACGDKIADEMMDEMMKGIDDKAHANTLGAEVKGPEAKVA